MGKNVILFNFFNGIKLIENDLDALKQALASSVGDLNYSANFKEDSIFFKLMDNPTVRILPKKSKKKSKK